MNRLIVASSSAFRRASGSAQEAPAAPRQTRGAKRESQAVMPPSAALDLLLGRSHGASFSETSTPPRWARIWLHAPRQSLAPRRRTGVA
jgi:hypothetical protein